MNKQHFITLLIMLVGGFTGMIHPQELHRTGLISEDISKVGWIKSYTPLKKSTPLPTSVDLSDYMPPVGNQGNEGSCVAWSIGYYAKTYEVRREKNWDVTSGSHIFSPAFIYNQVNYGVDSGITFSDAALLLTNSGCATLDDCPYTVGDFTSLPTESAFMNALYFRSESVFSIGTSSEAGISALKGILSDNKVVSLAINVWTNFDLISAYNNIYSSVERYGKNRGGHAITLVGYDDSLLTSDGYGAFKFVNSWGTGWGTHGYGWITYKAAIDNAISQGYALLINNRTNYSPLLVGKIYVLHNSRGSVNFQFGLGSPSAPLTSCNYSFPTKSYLNLPLPANKIVFDLTDFLTNMKAGTSNTIFLQCIDNNADANSAIIDSFSVTDLLNSQTINGITSPVTVPDKGDKTINITMTPTNISAPVQLISPSNGESDVSENPSLAWNSSGSGTYRVKVSTDDINFDNNLVYSTTTNALSVQLPILERNKIYYWKVAANNTENWSATWSFRITVINSHDYITTAQTVNWIDIGTSGTEITDWINIDNSGTVWTSAQKSTVKDDGYSANKIPLGFSFDFYGTQYDSLYVGVNGLVSFTNQKLNAALGGLYAYTSLGCFSQGYFPPENQIFPASIAVAYGDFDLDKTDGYGGGKIVYATLADKFILSWLNVGSFNGLGDTTNSFQLILNKSDYSITMNYKSFGKTSTEYNIKSGVQNCDTSAVMWVTEGLPTQNLIKNNFSVLFKKAPLNGINEKNIIAKAFSLAQNYPNPFNPSTTIHYSLPGATHVSLKVYDVLGHEVANLLNADKPAGNFSVEFNGARLASGIYFYRLSTPLYSEIKKMLLLK